MTDMIKVTNDSTELAWHPESRLVVVRYVLGTTLQKRDGEFLVDSMTSWIGSSGEPFGVLADALGLRGTDAEYRAKASSFFRQHRDDGFIALVNLGPVIHIVVELFRIGTGIQLKTFANDAAARAWLQTRGVAA